MVGVVSRAAPACLALLLALACAGAQSFEPRDGPMFANSSDFEIDLDVLADGKSITLLRGYHAHRVVAIANKVRVQTIVVMADKKRYELSEPDYKAQAARLALTRQLWIFDGKQICVLDRKLWRTTDDPSCALGASPH